MTSEKSSSEMIEWDQKDDGGSSIVSLTTMATITVVCAILIVAKDLFLPLALAMLMAFVLTPVVNFLRRRGMRDTPAVLVTVTAAAALVGAFVLVFAYQLSVIGTNLPKYQGNVVTKIDSLLEAGGDSGFVSHLSGMVDGIMQRIEQKSTAVAGPGDDAVMKVEVVKQTSMQDWLVGVILPALTPVAIFGLIFVLAVLALLERGALRDKLVQLIGGSNILASSRLLAEAGGRVSDYLFAQLVVNAIYALPIWLGLWLIGVPNALFFGIVTLVMRFVPYIGTAVSAILPLTMAFAVSPDWSLVLMTAGLFLLVEAVTSNVVEPWFYGRRTGVSPLAVIVSAMFWTWAWGPMGLMIAMPLTVCLVVIGHHVPSLRLFSILFGDKPALTESAQLYDRLLAGHAFAFTETAALSTANHYLAEYYDQTAIPALAMAQADYEAGLLSDDQAHRIARAAWALTEELETVVEGELSEAEVEVEGEAAPGEDDNLLNNGVLDGVGRRVAVLGARTRLDDAAALMVAQAMRAEGANTIALSHRSLSTAVLRDFAPETIIVTALDGTVEQGLDLSLRMLRRRHKKTQIGVALWPDARVDNAAPPASLPGSDFVARGMEATMRAAFGLKEG